MLCKFQAATSHYFFSIEMKNLMELVRSCCWPIFNLNNTRTTVLYAKKVGCRWRNMSNHILFFLIQLIWTYHLVLKVGYRESGDMGSIPDDCWNPLPLLSHFAWHWATLAQCSDMRAFWYCCTLFFFLGFRQWLSSADRVVNLNTNSKIQKKTKAFSKRLF